MAGVRILLFSVVQEQVGAAEIAIYACPVAWSDANSCGRLPPNFHKLGMDGYESAPAWSSTFGDADEILIS